MCSNLLAHQMIISPPLTGKQDVRENWLVIKYEHLIVQRIYKSILAGCLPIYSSHIFIHKQVITNHLKSPALSLCKETDTVATASGTSCL